MIKTVLNLASVHPYKLSQLIEICFTWTLLAAWSRSSERWLNSFLFVKTAALSNLWCPILYIMTLTECILDDILSSLDAILYASRTVTDLRGAAEGCSLKVASESVLGFAKLKTNSNSKTLRFSAHPPLKHGHLNCCKGWLCKDFWNKFPAWIMFSSAAQSATHWNGWRNLMSVLFHPPPALPSRWKCSATHGESYSGYGLQKLETFLFSIYRRAIDVQCSFQSGMIFSLAAVLAYMNR